MSGYLIELSGSAKGCAVKPTCGRRYTSKKGDDCWVDMQLINDAGCDGFLKIAGNYSNILITCVAFGMKTCVQVELPYPWSKHELIANVPIEAYCKNSYFDSVIHVVKQKLTNLFK